MSKWSCIICSSHTWQTDDTFLVVCNVAFNFELELMPWFAFFTISLGQGHHCDKNVLSHFLSMVGTKGKRYIASCRIISFTEFRKPLT